MHMQRHYFISDDLDDLEVFEEQLEAAGVSSPQIHVLSMHDEELDHHEHIHKVQSFMKKDIVHCGEIGLVIGMILSTLSLAVAYYAGWTTSAAGWMPFIFLAVVLLGFCTWEGGLMGIGEPNYHFARFEDALKNDKHIFIVDAEPTQEELLDKVAHDHPKIELAGTGASTPHWLLVFQKVIPRFFRTTFP